MKIVILDGYTANPGDLSWEELENLGELTVYDRTSADETVTRAADADIVLTNKVILGRKEMGQMVFAHLLTVTNHVEHYANENRNGQWSRSKDFCYWDAPLTELAGKTFGIVGLGNIGMQVAKIAAAFGMRVIAYTSKDESALPLDIAKAKLPELFATSDVLSLHCPLTDSTRHLINADTLAQMKPTVILINTGRGPLVDDEAIANALSEGKLAAYCADVMTEEPPKADNPLLKQSHAYLTPHIAWASTEARMRLIQVATDNVRAFINGQPQNVVS